MVCLARGVEGSGPYGDGELEVGMMCVYRNKISAIGITVEACPARVGRVLRVVRETTDQPYVIIQSMWPVLKPDKFGDKVNVYGTWV